MSDTLLLIDCTEPSFFTCYGYLSFMTEMNIINVMGIKTKLRNVPIYRIIFWIWLAFYAAIYYQYCQHCISLSYYTILSELQYKLQMHVTVLK